MRTREKGIITYAQRLRTLSRAFNGNRSVKTTMATGIVPNNLTHLLKETNGKSDHRILEARYT
jgi:hypothetical protein